MNVCATLGSAGTRFRGKNPLKTHPKKKVTESLYCAYAWGRPYQTDCDGSLHICVTNVINHANFGWLYVKGFGFSEGQI
jgi:hypothetical protein